MAGDCNWTLRGQYLSMTSVQGNMYFSLALRLEAPYNMVNRLVKVTVFVSETEDAN